MNRLQIEKLALRLNQDFASFNVPRDVVWTMPPSAKVIDCVLSLRANYAKVVEPRVKRFVVEHSEVKWCKSLRQLIASFTSPMEFSQQVLGVRHARKAAAIHAVVEYLIEVQGRFEGDSEEAKLLRWAQWSRPGDFLEFEAPGFKLAGFQYLRMLFGGDTVKPDQWILEYVREALGQEIGAGPTVYLIETVAREMGVSARSIDVAIWHSKANKL